MEFTHERFGRCEVKELTQRDVEKFFGDMRKASVLDLSKVEYDGAAIRKAVELKLFVEPMIQPGQVDEMAPSRIRWLSDCLAEAVEDALNVSPLS